MNGDAPLVLRLELDGTGEAIRGRLSADGGPAMPFMGWLGLAAAIERATQADGAGKMRDDPS